MSRTRAMVAAAALCAALSTTAACSTRAPAVTAPTAATIEAPCDETEPSPPDARPPALTGTIQWFGRNDLWVGLPDYAPVAEGDALVLKFPWVTLDGGEPSDERGAPSISASRTDAAGSATGSAGEYARSFGTGALAFWPTAVTFPAPGCWTVTGTLGSTTVQFVVDVDRP